MNTGRYKKEIQEVTDLSDERKLKPKAAIQKAKSNSMCIKFIFSLQILQEMRISDHLTCLLRNLYAGQEATIRTKHGTTDLFQIAKGIHQGCILSTVQNMQIHIDRKLNNG